MNNKKEKKNNKKDSNGKQEIISSSKESELIVEKGTSFCILRKYIHFQKSREGSISVSLNSFNNKSQETQTTLSRKRRT